MKLQVNTLHWLAIQQSLRFGILCTKDLLKASYTLDPFSCL